MEKEKPLGIFDSGIGGLTVVKRITSILPLENIVYFGDTARVPYGSKSNSTVIEYSIQDTKFLLSKNVKLIVVACNTASSVALKELRNRFDITFVGMIEPGATIAVESTKNGKVGVIGTSATINNKAYSWEINKLDPKIQVYEKACPLFVPLAEEGWINHKATHLIAQEYLKELKEQKVDTIVLGCTHYPILSGVIQDVMGENVILIDSGVAAAKVVLEELDRMNLYRNSNSPGTQDYYVSDIPQKFKEISKIFMERNLDQIKKVDLESLTALYQR
jgi:glutamate racemase